MQVPAASPPAPRGSDGRWRRRNLRILLGVGLLLLGVLFFPERHFAALSRQVPLPQYLLLFGFINLYVLGAILLLFYIGRNLIKLFLERRDPRLWSRLRTRLVVPVLAFSFVTALVFFFVASGSITYRIERYFNRELDSSLDEALEVSKTYYTTAAENAVNAARQVARGLVEYALLEPGNEDTLRSYLSLKRDEYDVGLIEVYDAAEHLRASAVHPRVQRSAFGKTDREILREALSGHTVSRIQSMGKEDIIRGAVPASVAGNAARTAGVVVVDLRIPESLVGKMVEIRKGVDDYRQAQSTKPVIERWLKSLLVVLLIGVVFAAMWFALKLSQRITQPLRELADATTRMARGDLSVRIEKTSDDEIGTFVDSFNTMTGNLQASQSQLARAVEDLREKSEELERRRRYMETVLRNVAAGVVSLDREGRIITINKSAEEIFAIKTAKVLGRSYRDVLRPEHRAIVREILHELQAVRRDSLEREVKLTLGERRLELKVNVTVLRDDQQQYLGMVVVFEDLSQLLRAQRVAAWRDVARRLAHEIKNPLTPIQLSAQRLRKRLSGRVGGEEEILEESTRVIEGQVEGLKRLVNEFSNFARMPVANPRPDRLNEILKEAVDLYAQAHRAVGFVFEPDGRIPVFDLDRDQIRRAIVNLLENAVAAVAEEGGRGRVAVRSEWDELLSLARVVVTDTGPGIAPEVRDRLFEPYVSTKKHGTGLGLAIVSRIASDHRGVVRAGENSPHGARFTIELPVRPAGMPEGAPGPLDAEPVA